MRKQPITIVRDGKSMTFTAILEDGSDSVAARIEGMRGLVAVGDDDLHAIKQLQGALILHLDGCDAEGIDPFKNDPDVPGLEYIL